MLPYRRGRGHDKLYVTTMRTWVISIVLVLALSPLAFATGGAKWDQSLYGQFAYESFSNSPYVDRPIDFADIDYPLLHAAIFFETNRMRITHSLTPFVHSPGLEKIAHEHSRDMVTHRFFSHESVVKGRETMGTRLATIGIPNARAAENIAYFCALEYEAGKPVFSPAQNGGFFSYTYKGEPIGNRTYLSAARAVVKQWMDSPLHRANILNGQYTYMGVGVAYYVNESFHSMPHFKVTQNFASVPGRLAPSAPAK